MDATGGLPESYEAALEELDTLVSRLESGDMPLAELMRGYERGALLLTYCRERLVSVEEQVKVLEGGMLKTWTNP
jgi:exodeoxyribonuclease VII small subunit